MKYFPEPERFHPERWEEISPDTNTILHMPFGGGQRACLGKDN